MANSVSKTNIPAPAAETIPAKTTLGPKDNCREKREARKNMPRNRKLPELILAGVLLTILFLVMLYAQFISPWEPDQLTPSGKFSPPSTTHFLGTDHLSRDVLTRIGKGASVTLLVAVGTVAVGALGGLLLGATAGYFGGKIDWLISRLIDSLLALPAILMALLVMTVWGRGIPQLIVALGIAFTPSFARIVRSAFRVHRGRNFVKRLEVMGSPTWRILFLHITPLLREQYLNAIIIGSANAILAESGMSYIGFGVPQPHPSWGSMLSDARAHVFRAPWVAIWPGVAIVATVLAIFLLHRAGIFLRKEEDYE